MSFENNRRQITEAEARAILLYQDRAITPESLAGTLLMYFVCLPSSQPRSVVDGKDKGTPVAVVGEKGSMWSSFDLEDLASYMEIQ